MAPVDPQTRLPLVPFEAIMRDPLPPIDWLVDPLIARGDRVVVYGEFGSMKSWLLLHLGLHMAAGQPWLGKFPLPERRRVLYVDEEMNERTLRRRIKRLGVGAGFEKEALPFQAMSRVGVRLNDQGAANLLRALENSRFDPEVVIVEALRRVLVGSENEARDISEFWRSVEPLRKGEKTLIVSHHMRKPSAAFGSNAPRDRASGSTDILAGADAAFAIARMSGDAVVIECVKSRGAEEASAFVVSLYDEDADGPVEMRYEGSRADFQALGSKVDQAITLVESFLSSAPKGIAERAAILAHLKAHKVAERTGERALDKLKKLGRVLRVGHGLWQLVTVQAA